MAKNMATFTLDGPKMLRKGEIGDWKNHFTPDIAKRFETEVMNELMDTGLTFDLEPWKVCESVKIFLFVVMNGKFYVVNWLQQWFIYLWLTSEQKCVLRLISVC